MADTEVHGGIIRWEDPPPARRYTPPGPRIINWLLIAAQCRSNPGDWGVACEPVAAGQSSSWQSRIVNAEARQWEPAGAFQAMTCTGHDGIRRFYVRYVGPPPVHNEPGDQHPA